MCCVCTNLYLYILAVPLCVSTHYAGEIKDVILCEIAMQRNQERLTRGGMMMLALTNRLRAHVFVCNVVVTIPVVIMVSVLQNYEGASSMADR